ncbi:M61 family metallopeptidase [Geminocystis sp. NIES-3709]|uniref:M61 family metallopeptidase n=1 Tax=Geminocystis sp. NIES-3709 TaxID=1617448 RepID=UPI0008256AE5|nr:M61 family metallopeptidase [Geminocystis sp. NIES-3709]
MNKLSPNLHYFVSMSSPESHLFEVTLNIENWQENTLDIKMPVWTPGSYLVREYSRHLQKFTVISADNFSYLSWIKKTKNHWSIETNDHQNITIKYQIYANDLTVRTNHLDGSHGYFNGAALFFYIPNYEKLPLKITIDPPQLNWQVTTSLPSISEEKNTFLAEDFDTLVDSPFEIGTQKIANFTVENKPHQWVIWGEGNIEIEKLIKDTEKIIKTEAKIFGDLPYEDYFFLLHLSASGFGGLEHKNCCVLNYPRFGFQKKEKYDRFIQLVAHEFFHLWNVKRIRPKALETFDYDQENYTTSLWFSEGSTSYYDMIIPLRAGIYNHRTFFDLLSKDISQYLATPGREIQPLRESSFDAWIKLYRRDAYSNNCQISYYLKGQLVTLLLDLLIRKNSDNHKSFDDVMLIMWQKFGKEEIGFTPEDLKREIELIANTDLTEFFYLYLDSTIELPFNEYFEPFGLKLETKIEHNTPPYLGLKTQKDGGVEKITFVDANSPAGKAGIDADDELLAIDNFRVTSDNLIDRLQDYQANDVIKLTYFHQEELKTVEVKLDSPKPLGYQVKIIENRTKKQEEMLNKWLFRLC